MWRINFLLILVVLAACNSEEEKTMLTKEEPQEIKIEETESDPIEKKELEVEFTLEDEIITLNAKNIPILDAYLETVQHKEATIKKMDLSKLDPESLYLLSFNCEQATCSYLLLDRDKPNRSYLIDDFVGMKDIVASSDLNKLVIILETNDTDMFQIFDLENWEPIILYTNKIKHDKIRILSSLWQNEHTVQMTYLDTLENTEHTVDLNVVEESNMK